MLRHLVRIVALLGWLLLYSRHGDGWKVVAQAQSEDQCEDLLGAHTAAEVSREIGGALAAQEADNPMRVQAEQRAARRVGERWRCTEDR